MVPARNLLRRHYDTYGGLFDDDETHYSKQSNNSNSNSSVNLMLMAEQQQQRQEQESEQEEEAKASNDSWLQLSIGGGGAATDAGSSSSAATAGPSPSVELELFPDKPSPSSTTSSVPTFPRHNIMPTMYSRPAPPPPWTFMQMGGSSSTTSFLPQMMMMINPPPPPQYQHQPQQQPFYNVQRLPMLPSSSGAHFGELRVVSPPTMRHHAAGIWFLLKAAENQVREPFLPQIPKSYLRIKDGRMTVKLLMKYLVKKLGLEEEFEVQISCRGQPLLPFLTLQHVRDTIWCLSEAVAILPDSPSTDHVMTLEYGRSQ